MSRSAWLLLILCGFFSASTALWLALNHAPSQWDDSWYLSNSLVMFDALSEGGLPGYALRFLTILRIKAPLITVLPTPAFLLLGRRARAAFLVNLAAMLVIFLFLYWFARKFRDARTGLLAVFIAGTMPLLYGLARWYLVEYSLAAFVCLTLALIAAVIESPTSRNLFLLGLTCGLGILLKTTYPLYVGPAIVYLCMRLLRDRRIPAASWLYLIAPAILLPLPWYAANFRPMLGRVLYSSFSDDAAQYGTGPVFSLFTIGQYFLLIVNRCLTPYYVLLAAALTLILALRRELPKWYNSWPPQARILLGLWLLPFIAFLFGRAKDIKYLAPILPLAALLIASLIDQLLLRGRSKPALAALLLLFPLIAFLHTSFGVFGETRLAPSGLAFLAKQVGYANVYEPQGWPHRAILDRIAASANFRPGEWKTVMTGTDYPEFNADNFTLAAIRFRLPLNIETSAYEPNLSVLQSQMAAAPFFIYKDGGGPDAGIFGRHHDALVRFLNDSDCFRELAPAVPLPDGGAARIFQNTCPK